MPELEYYLLGGFSEDIHSEISSIINSLNVKGFLVYSNRLAVASFRRGIRNQSELSLVPNGEFLGDYFSELTSWQKLEEVLSNSIIYPLPDGLLKAQDIPVFSIQIGQDLVDLLESYMKQHDALKDMKNRLAGHVSPIVSQNRANFLEPLPYQVAR